MKRGHIVRRFGLFCVRSVYYLPKSTEFRDTRTECQITLIHFLLLISNHLLVIAKC